MAEALFHYYLGSQYVIFYGGVDWVGITFPIVPNVTNAACVSSISNWHSQRRRTMANDASPPANEDRDSDFVDTELTGAELEIIATDLSSDARWSLNPSRTEARCC